MNRKSFASMNFNSTMGASTLVTTRRTDPRPLKDKVYQAECRKNLAEFLLTNGFPCFNPKMLVSPTKKDFESMLRFMLLIHDEDMGLPNGNAFSSEAHGLIKALGYPFSISKTTFDAAGASHTWPTLLGLLDFYRKSIELRREISEKMEATRLNNVNEDRFQVSAEAYQIYLDSPNEETSQEALEEYNKEVLLSFQNRHMEVQKALEDVEEENRYHTQRLEELRAAYIPVPTLQSEIRDKKQTTRKLTDLSILKESSIRRLDQAAAELRAKLDNEVTVLAIKERENASVTNMINSQPLSQTDVEELTTKTKSRKSTVKEMQEAVEQLEKVRGENKATLQGVLHQLRKLNQQMNTLLGTQDARELSSRLRKRGINFTEIRENASRDYVSALLKSDDFDYQYRTRIIEQYIPGYLQPSRDTVLTELEKTKLQLREDSTKGVSNEKQIKLRLEKLTELESQVDRDSASYAMEVEQLEMKRQGLLTSLHRLYQEQQDWEQKTAIARGRVKQQHEQNSAYQAEQKQEIIKLAEAYRDYLQATRTMKHDFDSSVETCLTSYKATCRTLRTAHAAEVEKYKSQFGDHF